MKPLALVLAAASSLAMAATSPALANHGRGYTEAEMVHKFLRIFDRLDHNHNNRVSRSGLRHLESRGRHHHDGPRVAVVFGDENFRIAFGTGGRRHHHSSRHGYIGPINSSTFYLYDLDRDGYIYRRELRRAVIREFHHADRNGDGYLSDWELERSGWYRTSLHRAHTRYYPDYRRHHRHRPIVIRTSNHHRHDGRHHKNRHRDDYRSGHRDGRRDGSRDGRRDAYRDGYREGRRDGHRTERRREGERDGTRTERRRTGDRDGTRTERRRTGDRDGTRTERRRTGDRDGTRTERRRTGDRDGTRTERRRERTRDGDRTERRRKRDGDGRKHRDREERRERHQD